MLKYLELMTNKKRFYIFSYFYEFHFLSNFHLNEITHYFIRAFFHIPRNLTESGMHNPKTKKLNYYKVGNKSTVDL